MGWRKAILPVTEKRMSSQTRSMSPSPCGGQPPGTLCKILFSLKLQKREGHQLLPTETGLLGIEQWSGLGSGFMIQGGLWGGGRGERRSLPQQPGSRTFRVPDL